MNTFTTTLSSDEFVDVMVENIKYWRHVHSGVRTATTGQQKTIPWILLVRCPLGHVTTTSRKRSMGMRFRCNETGFRPGTGSVLCERRVEIIEVPDMENVCGLSKEDAEILHQEWKGKNT